MLPHVLEFHLQAAAAASTEIARAMGANVWGKSQLEAAKLAVDSVSQLSRDVGMPQRLRDAEVKEDVIAIMAAKAMADHCHERNPQKCTEADMVALYQAAF